MDRMIKKTLKLFSGSDDVRFSRRFKGRPTLRQLIQRESEIGGKLFGPVPKGHHRQFFNLDENTWVWYEEWKDGKGKQQSTTTRYEIHESGILKIQDKTPYYFLDGSELKNFMTAIRLYYEQVSTEVYYRDPVTGNPIAVS